VLSPAFAQTTNVIPSGGKWQTLVRAEPFDSLDAACQFKFDFGEKQRPPPTPACAANKLSGKKLYQYIPTSETEGMGVGHCYVTQAIVNSKFINGEFVKTCTGFQESPFPIVVIHTPAKQTCPVEPLKPITDPDALRFENGDKVREDKLDPSMKKKLDCLRDAVSKAGGKLEVTSAWRPMAYQNHLFEIYSKRKKINSKDNKKNPACKAIIAEIEREYGPKPGHGIKSRVAEKRSLHEDGLAFDASWSNNISDSKIDVLAASCKLNRPFKDRDDDFVHFQ
jgi:hypothetical protein